MKPSAAHAAHVPFGFDPLLFGTLCSALSSVAYSASNVCLRSAAGNDPFLVSCVKAVPTMLVAIALLTLSWRQGRLKFPSPRAFAALTLVGTIAQLCGNGAFQWSLSQVGLALTVPICAGSMIISATVLGRVWLGEAVTPRSAVALAILITSITVLSVGAERAPELAEIATASVTARPAVHVGIVLAAACGAGIAYALLNVLIRKLVTGSFAMPFVLAIVSSTGVISLGLASIAKIGWPAIEQTPMSDVGMMFLAGSFNAIAFLALTKALQLVSLVQVNAVSASQSALAAIAGVVIFGEMMTLSLIMGVLLTVLGLTLVDRGRKLHGVKVNTEPDATAPTDEAVAVPPLQMPGVARLPREPTNK